MVVELAVAVVVAVVVEVDVAVTGGVPFGHPRHPKMSNIILITFSDKVIVLKKNYYQTFHATALPEQPPPRFYPL
jgi:hypothetical protein